MRKVHIVMELNDYEPSFAVKAFANETRARQLLEKIRKHIEKRPECPDIEDSPENDRLWEEWDKKRSSWVRRHPAGLEHANSIDFDVVTIPFVGGD